MGGKKCNRGSLSGNKKILYIFDDLLSVLVKIKTFSSIFSMYLKIYEGSESWVCSCGFKDMEKNVYNNTNVSFESN